MSQPERYPRLRIVLVEPRYDGNLGQIARAMRNFGLSRLRLVGGDADPEADEARWFARAEGAQILAGAERFATLEAAIADCQIVVGTSRRLGRDRGEPQPPETLLAQLAPWESRCELAILFGREAHGLFTDELDLCQHLVTIPSDDAAPSLNLSHAVSVIGYVLYRLSAAAGLPGELPPAEPRELATHEQLEGMYQHLRRVWVRIGYLNAQNPDAILRRWRRILGEVPLTVHDVNVIRALAHQTDWVARKAEIPEEGPPAAPHLFNKHVAE